MKHFHSLFVHFICQTERWNDLASVLESSNCWFWLYYKLGGQNSALGNTYVNLKCLLLHLDCAVEIKKKWMDGIVQVSWSIKWSAWIRKIWHMSVKHSQEDYQQELNIHNLFNTSYKASHWWHWQWTFTRKHLGWKGDYISGGIKVRHAMKMMSEGTHRGAVYTEKAPAQAPNSCHIRGKQACRSGSVLTGVFVRTHSSHSSLSTSQWWNGIFRLFTQAVEIRT